MELDDILKNVLNQSVSEEVVVKEPTDSYQDTFDVFVFKYLLLTLNPLISIYVPHIHGKNYLRRSVHLSMRTLMRLGRVHGPF